MAYFGAWPARKYCACGRDFHAARNCFISRTAPVSGMQPMERIGMKSQDAC